VKSVLLYVICSVRVVLLPDNCENVISLQLFQLLVLLYCILSMQCATSELWLLPGCWDWRLL